MKNKQPLSFYEIAFVAYCFIVGVGTALTGAIYLLTNYLWLVGVIIGLPLAIYGGLRLKRYVFEGGLEEDFITKTK